MMKNGNLNETQMVMQLFLKYRYCLNQYNEKEEIIRNTNSDIQQKQRIGKGVGIRIKLLKMIAYYISKIKYH